MAAVAFGPVGEIPVAVPHDPETGAGRDPVHRALDRRIADDLVLPLPKRLPKTKSWPSASSLRNRPRSPSAHPPDPPSPPPPHRRGSVRAPCGSQSRSRWGRDRAGRPDRGCPEARAARTAVLPGFRHRPPPSLANPVPSKWPVEIAQRRRDHRLLVVGGHHDGIERGRRAHGGWGLPAVGGRPGRASVFPVMAALQQNDPGHAVHHPVRPAPEGRQALRATSPPPSRLQRRWPHMHRTRPGGARAAPKVAGAAMQAARCAEGAHGHRADRDDKSGQIPRRGGRGARASE